MGILTEKQIKATQKDKKQARGRPDYGSADTKTATLFKLLATSKKFNRNSDISLWVQLKNALSDKIADGTLKPNARLPSELAMADMFQLSRPVIRNALSALVAEGLIVKQARKGVFVSAKPHEFGFMTFATSVFDDLASRGMDVEVRTYEFGLFDPDQEEIAALRLPPGFKVIRFVRVYIADGAPITHSRISLPAHRLPGMENFQMENKSIFGTIREYFGLTVARAERNMSAEVADTTIAERLGVEEGQPLIHIHSIAYDHDNLPLEFYKAFYNSKVAPIHIAVESTSEVS